MEEKSIRISLRDLPLGGLRYFDRTGSTNDVALAWAADNAPDLAMVYAEEQTAGRGRGNRKWYTPAGTALAFSLVLRLASDEEPSLSRFSGLGALAVVDALKKLNLDAAIKWPNDILLNGRKVCGILVEAVWMGERVENVVMGIGINVRREAVPPAELLAFPATSLEGEKNQSLDRLALLREILLAILHWRPLIASGTFLQAWEDRLAFRGEQVEVESEKMPAKMGRLDGLNPDGSLRLTSPAGETFSVNFGEVHLHPVV